MNSVFLFFAFFSLPSFFFFFKWEVLLGEGKDVGKGRKRKRDREKEERKSSTCPVRVSFHSQSSTLEWFMK